MKGFADRKWDVYKRIEKLFDAKGVRKAWIDRVMDTIFAMTYDQSNVNLIGSTFSVTKIAVSRDFPHKGSFRFTRAFDGQACRLRLMGRKGKQRWVCKEV